MSAFRLHSWPACNHCSHFPVSSDNSWINSGKATKQCILGICEHHVMAGIHAVAAWDGCTSNPCVCFQGKDCKDYKDKAFSQEVWLLACSYKASDFWFDSNPCCTSNPRVLERLWLASLPVNRSASSWRESSAGACASNLTLHAASTWLALNCDQPSWSYCYDALDQVHSSMSG